MSDDARRRDRDDPAIEAFAGLVEAVRRREYVLAGRLRGRLRALGWSVLPVAPAREGRGVTIQE